jgi:hypothetical protein
MATARQKNDAPRGGRWSKLETPGDVRRFLRWVILQTKADKLDVKKANCLGQLGVSILRAMEVSTLEERQAAIERALAEDYEHESSNSPYTH